MSERSPGDSVIIRRIRSTFALIKEATPLLALVVSGGALWTSYHAYGVAQDSLALNRPSVLIRLADAKLEGFSSCCVVFKIEFDLINRRNSPETIVELGQQDNSRFANFPEPIGLALPLTIPAMGTSTVGGLYYVRIAGEIKRELFVALKGDAESHDTTPEARRQILESGSQALLELERLYRMSNRNESTLDGQFGVVAFDEICDNANLYSSGPYSCPFVYLVTAEGDSFSLSGNNVVRVGYLGAIYEPSPIEPGSLSGWGSDGQ